MVIIPTIHFFLRTPEFTYSHHFKLFFFCNIVGNFFTITFSLFDNFPLYNDFFLLLPNGLISMCPRKPVGHIHPQEELFR